MQREGKLNNLEDKQATQICFFTMTITLAVMRVSALEQEKFATFTITLTNLMSKVGNI